MAISDVNFAWVQQAVRKDAAIVVAENKRYLVESRLSALCRQRKVASIDALVELARSPRGQDVRVAVVEAMTTNETSFLRDFHPFELMRTRIIPELLRKRQMEKKLHIWCGASSSGQEPYTLCMMLREHFPELTDWTIGFIASDFSQEMLDRAQRGVYSQLEVNRGLPAALLVKYFDKQGAGWQVKPSIREMVQYRRINLAERWPPMPPLDLVLLRNVLIYFDVDTKKDILRRVRECMRPDGYLFLGGAETTFNLDDHFERVQVGQTGCYRLRAR